MRLNSDQSKCIPQASVIKLEKPQWSSEGNPSEKKFLISIKSTTRIRLNNPEDLRVFFKIENKNHQLKVLKSEVRNQGSKIVISVDLASFKQPESSLTEEEFSFSDVETLILPTQLENQVETGNGLASTNLIQDFEDNSVLFSGYPISFVVKQIIFDKKSQFSALSVGAAKGLSSAVKPITITLMFFSFSMATVMIKLLQVLEFLSFINIETLPENIKYLLHIFGEENFFENFSNPIIGESKWKFYDPATMSDENESESNLENTRALADTEITNQKQENSQICYAHPLLNAKGLSCYAWNNTGSLIIQIAFFGLLKLTLMFLTRMAASQLQIKAMKGQNRLSSSQIIQGEESQQNLADCRVKENLE